MSADQQQRFRYTAKPPFAGHVLKYDTGNIRPQRNTRPVPNSRPNANLVEAPYKGWNMSGLNTYRIPRHEQNQLYLYSKFVLRDPKAEPYSDLVSRVQNNIYERDPQLKHPPTNIKQAYRNALGGKTNMSPKGTTSHGIDPYELMGSQGVYPYNPKPRPQ
jgi:hypothetical protein